jgi:hypothetical protein
VGEAYNPYASECFMHIDYAVFGLVVAANITCTYIHLGIEVLWVGGDSIYQRSQDHLRMKPCQPPVSSQCLIGGGELHFSLSKGNTSYMEATPHCKIQTIGH